MPDEILHPEEHSEQPEGRVQRPRPQALRHADATATAREPTSPSSCSRKPVPPAPPEPKRPLAARTKEEASQSPFSVTVGQVYDGPLDLLLDLIRKQNIDIYDIPIARITAQFLDYTPPAEADRRGRGGRVHLHGLAADPHQVEDAAAARPQRRARRRPEDPRRELVERLLEHERFKAAAQMLMQKQQIEEATWTNPGIREFNETTPEPSARLPPIRSTWCASFRRS